MKFNNVELSDSTIIATRQHFADIMQGCIDEVLSGDVKLASHINPEWYFSECKDRAKGYLTGNNDFTFTFLQRALWIQTGECVALLPK